MSNAFWIVPIFGGAVGRGVGEGLMLAVGTTDGTTMDGDGVGPDG
jgi:hypothetical protein